MHEAAVILQRAEQVARDVLAPRAAETDRSWRIPGENIAALASAGLLGLNVPAEFGGHGVTRRTVRAYHEILASACGATAFLQLQHQAACGQIAASSNQALREELLPVLASGREVAGIAFAHVRRPGPPAMRVTEVADGFIFDGTAAWFSGWGIMNSVVMAGALTDGRLVFAVLPLQGETVSASEPMALVALTATSTVMLSYRKTFVPRDRWVKTITFEEQLANDRGAILNHTAMALGVSSASARILREIAVSRGSERVGKLAEAVASEAAAIRSQVDEWADRLSEEGYEQNAVRVRSWSTEHAVRAAQAAAVGTGGGAMLLSHPAQRLLREALVYNVTSLPSAVQLGNLDWLTDRMLDYSTR